MRKLLSIIFVLIFSSVNFSFGQCEVESLEMYLKKKEYTQGILHAHGNYCLENGNGASTFLLGEMYVKLGRFYDAYNAYNIALSDSLLKKSDRKKASKHIAKHQQNYRLLNDLLSSASEALENNDLNLSHKNLQKASKIDAMYSPLVALKLKLEASGNNADSVWHYYKLNTALNPYRIAAYREAGGFFEKIEDYNKAIKVYLELVKIYKASGLFEIAGVYFLQGEFLKAIDFYTQSNDIHRDKTAIFNIGLCYKSLNEYKQALTVFLRLKRENYENKRLDLMIAHCYYEMDDYTKAIETYSESLKKYPNNEDAYYFMGYSYYYKERDASWGVGSRGKPNDSMFVKAFEYVSKAAEINPKNPKNFSAKSEVLSYFNSRPNRQREQLIYMGQAIALDSNNFEYWKEYFSCFTNSGASEEEVNQFGEKAVNHFKSLLNQANINKAKTLNSIGNLYAHWMGANYDFENKVLDDSCTFYRKAAFLLEPTNKKYYEDLFYLSILLNNPIDTAFCFEYLKKNPNDFKLWHQLFVKLCQNKNYAKANVIYEKVNLLFPETDLAKAINYEVRKMPKKYKWSDICKKQKCYYFEKYTSLDFFDGPYSALPK